MLFKQDLGWWYREKMLTLNLTTWNHPRISVLTEESFPGWSGTDDIIQQGDLLHIDWGITAMGMNTDTQHMAYVLRDGETDAPDSLKQGLKKANRMQDIHLDIMRAGMTGNEVLENCLAQMKIEGIEGQIYSHPIGDWGTALFLIYSLLLLSEYFLFSLYVQVMMQALLLVRLPL